MMSITAFYSGILVAAVFTVTVSTSCPETITCPCGSGNQKYTHCLDNMLKTKHTCATWAHCRTCRANVTHCVTCPPKRIGPTCTKVLFTAPKVHIRRKRQFASHPDTTPFGGEERTCSPPTVDPNGSIGFMSQNNGKFDIGTIVGFVCNRGYVMEGRRSITCQQNGQWNGHSPICRPRDTNCGRSLVQTEGEASFGTSMTAGEYPWVVLIFMEDTGEICGGALLDRWTVLSAAHCFQNTDSVTLYFGKHFRSSSRDDGDVVKRTSNRIINHPNFNPDTFDNDIAIVRFYPAVSYSRRIQPICMPTTDSTPENIQPGKIGHIAGWGLNENQLASWTLMLARLPVQKNDVCEAVYKKKGQQRQISPGMFCAGLKYRKMNVCKGDSGSPLVFYKNETKRYTLEGLVSHGLKGNCDVPERYSIFTKVAHYTHWIRNQ